MKWEDVLKYQIEQPYFKDLATFVSNRRKITDVYPKTSDVFRALELVELEQVKVVIIGQDPYHGHGQANGLAFAMNNDQKIPPSLMNIFKEIQKDIGHYPSTYNDLLSWADQGVLLLNSVLTVDAGRPGSHSNRGWEHFNNEIIKNISYHRENVVFMLWGEHAKNKSELIDDSIHLILTAAHPSPLSAHRGFFGCKHFSKTNEYLSANGLNVIRW